MNVAANLTVARRYALARALNAWMIKFAKSQMVKKFVSQQTVRKKNAWKLLATFEKAASL
jgi:hypothetical protein